MLRKWIWMFALVLSACAPAAVNEPPASVTPGITTDTPAATQSPVQPLTTVATAPAGSPAYTPGAGLPPGLVYTLGAGDGLWVVDASGQPSQLNAGYLPQLSLDGKQALYTNPYEGEIRLADLASGATRNLTNTPDVNESGYQWWPGNPGVVLFYYKPMNDGGISNGSLAQMNINVGGYQVIEGGGSSLGTFAASPDGRSIALDVEGQAAIYRAETGVQPINLADFGVGAGRAINPAWSPDGKRLAWVLINDNGYAVAVLDLETRQGVQFHPFSAIGGGMQPALSFSPDGEWLALTSFEAGKSGALIWALSSDGSREIPVGSGVGPVWSADGRFLIFTSTPQGAGSFLEDQVMLAQVGDWQPIPLELPAGARPLGWMHAVP